MSQSENLNFTIDRDAQAATRLAPAALFAGAGSFFRLPVMLAVLALGGWQIALAGSQVIGYAPEMSGGFEDEIPRSPITELVSFENAQSLVWTVQATDHTFSQVSGTGGRSGPKFATFGTTATHRIVSPTTAPCAITFQQRDYVVQFYYRTTDSTDPTGSQVGVCQNGTSRYDYVNIGLTGTAGNWQKISRVSAILYNSVSCSNGTATIRFNGSSTVNVDFDDFVVYPGTEPDTSPPESPGAVSVGDSASTSLKVSWGAATGGVDGGGYLVVRGMADPVTPPNSNGIYAVGNSIGSGVVAYLGTDTSFTDIGLAPEQTYHYRVYTADKAFNYSSPSAGQGATSAGSPSDRPSMLPLGFAGTNLVVRFQGTPGVSYGIESAEKPNGPWTNRATIYLGSGTNTGSYTDPGPRPASRFYRAGTPP